MNDDVERQIDLGRAPQSLAEDLRLDLELMFVTGVLVMTAAALGEVGTARMNAMLRGLNDRIYAGSSEAGFLLGE